MIFNARKLLSITFDRFLVHTRYNFFRPKSFTFLCYNKFFCTVNETLKESSLNASNKPLKSSFNLSIPLFFESHPDYAQLIYKKYSETQKLDQNCQISKILTEFISDLENTSVLDELPIVVSEELKSSEFEKFLEIMNILFQNFKLRKTHVWPNLIKILENELVLRGKNLSLNEIFRCMYIIRNSGLHGKINYYYNKVISLCDKADKLNYEQCMVFLFLISKFKIVKYEVEKVLSPFIPNLKPEELYVVASFYINQKKTPQSTLTSKLLDKLFEIMFDPETVYLKKMFDVLLNIDLINKSNISNFFEKLKAFKEQLHPIYLAYCILLQQKYNFFDQDMTETAMEKIKENIEIISSSLLGRLTIALALLNIKDEKFLELMISRYESTENNEQLKPTVVFLKGLIFFEKYPEKFLKSTMTEEFLNKLVSEKTVSAANTWSWVNRSLAIDCPKFHCNTNHKKYLKSYPVGLFENGTSIPIFHKSLHPIKDVLTKTYGTDKIKLVKPLQQSQKVLLMKFGKKNLQSQPVLEEDINNIKNHSDYFFIGIFPVLQSFYTIDNKYNFVSRTVLRHFTALGYNCLPVSESEFIIRRKKNEEVTYLQALIDEKLKELSSQENI